MSFATNTVTTFFLKVTKKCCKEMQKSEEELGATGCQVRGNAAAIANDNDVSMPMLSLPLPMLTDFTLHCQCHCQCLP